MTSYYLDTSVAAAALLGLSKAAASWVDQSTGDEQTVVLSSRILATELTRVLRRESLPVSMRNDLLESLATVPLSEAVLSQAEAITPHVKTLDAIHLASALASGYHPILVTHDQRMAEVAVELGLSTFDPMAN